LTVRIGYNPGMVAEDERPIGAPVLEPRPRRRVAVWVARHPWSVHVIRWGCAVALVLAVTLVLGTTELLEKLAALVIGALLGGVGGERVRHRGEEEIRMAEYLPREFAGHFPDVPDNKFGGVHDRPRFM
jgi:hypothetical protein